MGGGCDAEGRAVVAAHAAVLLDRPIRVVGAAGRPVLTGRSLGARPLVAESVQRAARAGVLARLGELVGLSETRAVPLEFALDRRSSHASSAPASRGPRLTRR